MAGIISAFFSTLLPSTRTPEQCAPTSLASESHAVDSTQDSASANTQETPYPFTLWEPKSITATLSAGTQDSAPANTEETLYPSTA
ncbi:hypothetical protein PG996_002280 [Apiospora saccharicola]|uniref:Uncharacterized protein n=1 Tax=Apiospora saccharicola TaxID=335842 RepID=A0ABR1WJ10_9PEZI